MDALLLLSIELARGQGDDRGNGFGQWRNGGVAAATNGAIKARHSFSPVARSSVKAPPAKWPTHGCKQQTGEALIMAFGKG